jgi:hypothetical protein
MTDTKLELFDVLLPVVVLLMVFVILHLLIVLFLPLRWRAIRSEFQRRLESAVKKELDGAFSSLPQEATQVLLQERSQVLKLRADAQEVAAWLHNREQAASISELYGSET